MPAAGKGFDIDRVNLNTKGDKHFKIAEGKAESRVAAYCGFSDRGEFRKFRFSSEVLRGFLWHHAYARDADQREALGYLWANCKTESKRQALEQSLGGSLEDILARYPTGDPTNKVIFKANKTKILAGLLYWLRREIQDIIDGKKSSAIQNYDNIKAQWATAFPELTLPQIDLSEITWPILGPLEKNEESECEAWNRCQAIINSLKTLTSKTKWNAFFKAKKSPFSAKPIHPDMIPSFMTGLALPTDLEIIDATAVRSDRAFTLTLSHYYEDEKLKAHIRTRVNTRTGPQFPVEEIRIRDPTDFPTGEEWRDALRRSLLFEELGVDFFDVRCHIMEPYQDVQQILFRVGSKGVPTEWSAFKEHLEKSQAKVITILYHLMVLARDEVVEYEYFDIPSNIGSFVVLGEDGDVQFRSHESSDVPNQNTIEASSSSKQPDITQQQP